MTHQELWAALERFAAKHKLSCSAMARKCGMDPTTFNKSKRFSKYGQPRWPSTETLAKILNATHSTLKDFIKCFPRSSGTSKK